MSEQEKIELLATWLEGGLSPSQQSKFESLCTSDSEFAQRVEQANYANMLSDTTADLPVPNWNKQASFGFVEQNNTNAWWQWQGFPLASFACSILAIVMVTTGFNIEYHNDRLSVGFGNKQDVATLLDQRVSEYQQSNQVLLAQYIEALQSQQLQSNTQLTEYLLSSSRQERREDFAELISFINQQRQDDQGFYARQINDLKQDMTLLTYAGDNTMYSPIPLSSDTAFNE